jgi:hypothetical protein
MVKPSKISLLLLQYSSHVTDIMNLMWTYLNVSITSFILFQQQRRLDVLTITSPGNMNPGNKRQRVVVILSRVHPGESPASFVCQGQTLPKQFKYY